MQIKQVFMYNFEEIQYNTKKISSSSICRTLNCLPRFHITRNQNRFLLFKACILYLFLIFLFSQIPSYWNLIRGLQNIDACILTHFDYDVLPGLQTVLHRKTIRSLHEGRPCKPDIGAFFLNHTQRTRFQSSNASKLSSKSKLLVNLSHNIDQVLNDIKQLNIDTFDLVKNTVPNKHTIEPINLYKKIAFGSLDLYVLYPTSSLIDDDKYLANLQKVKDKVFNSKL